MFYKYIFQTFALSLMFIIGYSLYYQMLSFSWHASQLIETDLFSTLISKVINGLVMSASWLIINHFAMKNNRNNYKELAESLLFFILSLFVFLACHRIWFSTPQQSIFLAGYSKSILLEILLSVITTAIFIRSYRVVYHKDYH